MVSFLSHKVSLMSMLGLTCGLRSRLINGVSSVFPGSIILGQLNVDTNTAIEMIYPQVADENYLIGYIGKYWI